MQSTGMLFLADGEGIGMSMTAKASMTQYRRRLADVTSSAFAIDDERSMPSLPNVLKSLARFDTSISAHFCRHA
jgi:hypothetical protein